MTHRLLTVGAGAATAALLTACGTGGSISDSADGAELRVVAAFYPVEFAAQQIARGVAGVEIETLTAPGVEPHDLELTPRQVGAVKDADLVVYSSGMQAAVDDAVAAQAEGHTLDTTDVVPLAQTGDDDSHVDDHSADAHSEEEHSDEAQGSAHEDHDHGAGDPDFCLDPWRYATAGAAIADELADLDPDNAEAYQANAQRFASDLTALDAEFADTLASCRHDTLVTTHEAFGYLADRYGFHQVGIAGITSDAEATPARMAEISDIVGELGISAIYAESTLGSDLAEVIGTETGTEVLVLDPIEGITDTSAGADYFEVMRANLEALQRGQECT